MSWKCDTSRDIDEFCGNSDMRMCENNRWVKLAETIPWQELCKQKGSKDIGEFRGLFAACLIEAHYGLDDEQTILMIQESPYLQYFCGMKGFNGTALPMDKAELSRFRSELGDAELNRMSHIIRR